MTLAPEATIPDLEVRTIEEAEAKPIDWARLSRLLGQYKGQKPAPRVLVIDDEADNRTLLSRAAGQNRWQVSEAANGWLGLRSVVEAPPDLILLDLMMPEMDGFEFLRLVRTSQAGQAIPVVVVTAKELTVEDRLRLSGSVHKILQKGSYDRQELFREVESLMTAHVGRRQAEAPAPQDAGTSPEPEPAVLAELRRRLELVEAERDEALEQLRAADESIGQPPPQAATSWSRSWSGPGSCCVNNARASSCSRPRPRNRRPFSPTWSRRGPRSPASAASATTPWRRRGDRPPPRSWSRRSATCSRRSMGCGSATRSRGGRRRPRSRRRPPPGGRRPTRRRRSGT